MPLDQRALAELGARSEITRLTTELLGIVSEFPRLALDASAQLAALTTDRRPPRSATPTPHLNGQSKHADARAPKPGPKRGTLSAKARKAMAANMRKRWRAAKKAGKSTLQKSAASAK